MQKLLIEMMLTEPSIYTRSTGILHPEYFHEDLQPVIRYIKEYTNNYKALPTYEEIKAKTKYSFKKIEDFNFNHHQAALDEIEQFCQQRGLELAILQSYEMISKGKRDGIDKIIKDAVLISLHRDLGLEYFENPRERLESLKSQQGALSSNWKSFDYITYGGFGWGELVYFLAESGGGKSVILQNLALNLSLQGHNVVYITLELSRELIAKRFDSMLTGIPNKEIFSRIDEVEDKVTTFQRTNTPGSIRIKFMKPRSTVNDIESYVHEYEIREKKIPHVIIIDYADLMGTSEVVSIENVHMKDKLISEDLRGFAASRTADQGKRTIILSASQLNRTGIDSIGEYSMTGISGGITKIFTADLVVAGYSTTAMRERNEYSMQFLKTRNSAGVGRKLTLGYNTETLRLTDLEEPEGQEVKTSSQLALDKLNKRKQDTVENISNESPPKERNMSLKDLIAKAKK